MIKPKTLFVLLTTLLLLFIHWWQRPVTPDGESAAVVNAYLFESYLPSEVAEQFTAETGIKINLIECTTSEMLLAKIKTGAKTGYDLVVTSGHVLSRMVALDLLEKLALEKITNLTVLYPFLREKRFNQFGDYGVPYSWGTVGIAANLKVVAEAPDAWQAFWSEAYRDKLMLVDDMREVFAIALMKLGYSVNDEEPKHIKEAYRELLKLLPNIRLFSSEGAANFLSDEDIVLGAIWQGDFEAARQRNANLVFNHPKEGFILWCDSLAILKDAPHKENAYKLLNFLLRPDVSQKVSAKLGFAHANKEADEKHYRALHQDETAERLTSEQLERAKIIYELSPPGLRLYQHYWEKLRIR